MLLLAFCAWGAAQSAEAACERSTREIARWRELDALNTQYRQSTGSDKPDAPEPEVEEYAVHLGHLLGRQALNLENRRDRQEKFDCLLQLAENLVQLQIMAEPERGAGATRLFREALLGALDDSALRRYGVDPGRKFPSIFTDPLLGRWIWQCSPDVGIVVSEYAERTYRCARVGPPTRLSIKNCWMRQVAENGYYMSFDLDIAPGIKVEGPAHEDIYLELSGDRLASPDQRFVYLRAPAP
ncbi:MAG: hypothetical protein L6R19_19640 [Alphaproteobacteria bacterium]|nr:hypothetical protein [Alphaproteobacteria bacterium]